MTKKELQRLRARIKRLKGHQGMIARWAGVSYMTVYRLREGLWESFRDSTLARVVFAVEKLEKIA